MTHPDEREWGAFLTGELSASASDAVAAHLDACANCRTVMERLTAVPPDVTASLLISVGSKLLDDIPTHGPTIAGYAEFRELGRGGSGIVYRARRLADDELVAIKMMRSGVFATSAERRWFLAEAEAALRLRHPNIVPVTAIGGRDTLPYFVMEYAFGGSLAGHLNGTPMSPDVASRLLEAVARAVQIAHDAGVIHRDLKPGNILLDDSFDPFSLPKVADFGMAKSAGEEPSTTPTQAVLGTPSYMAPEQAFGRSKQVGTTADVYSLGAILYELLTGRPPFKGETPYETLLQVRTLPLVRPRSLRPDTPKPLEAICLKCLERDPKQRYPTAAALADDLVRYSKSGSAQARLPGPMRRLKCWAKAYPTTAVLTGVLAAVLVASVVALSLFWLHAESQRQHAEEQRHEAERHAEATRQSRIAARKTLVLYAKTTIRFFRTPESMTAEEIDALRKANIEAEEVLSAPTGDPQEEHDAAYALLQLADSLKLICDFDTSLRLCRTGLGALKRLAEEHPDRLRFAFDYSQGCSQLSGVLQSIGKPVEAEAMTREAIRVGERVQARKPDNDECGGAVASYRSHLAIILTTRGEYAAAEPLFETALVETRRLYAKYPDDPLRREFARAVLLGQADLSFARDRSIDGYVEYARFGLSLVRANRGSYLRPNWSPVLASAVNTSDPVAALDHVGRRREGDALVAEGLAAAESLFAEAPTDLLAKLTLADQRVASAKRQENAETARDLFRRAVQTFEEMQGTSCEPIANERLVELWATCFDATLRDTRRALTFARREPKLQHLLGLALYADGRYDEAREVLAKNTSDARQIRRRSYLILTLMKLGEKDSARKELDCLTDDLRTATRLSWHELPDWATVWNGVHQTEPPVLWQKK